jgi:hypothetical protein
LGFGEYISKNMGDIISDFDEFDDFQLSMHYLLLSSFTFLAG